MPRPVGRTGCHAVRDCLRAVEGDERIRDEVVEGVYHDRDLAFAAVPAPKIVPLPGNDLSFVGNAQAGERPTKPGQAASKI